MDVIPRRNILNESSEGLSDADLDDVPLVAPDKNRVDNNVSTGPSAARPPPVPVVRGLNLKGLSDGTSLASFSKLKEAHSEPNSSVRPPKLALQSTRTEISPPRTTRGMKPPMLHLPDPATASPVASPARSSTYTPAPTSERLAVQLLSTAFTIPTSTLRNLENSVRNVILQRCVASLGVAAEELRVFDLRELSADEEVPFSCRNVGVLVNNSSFSLGALEDMIGQNQQLLATVEKNSHTLEALHRDYKDASADAARTSTRAGERETESARFKERCRSLEHDNTELRRQLQQSESGRQELQITVAGLRAEFDTLRRMVEHAQLAIPSPTTTTTNTTGARVTTSPTLNHNSSRFAVAELLKVFEEMQLAKLEDLSVAVRGSSTTR